MRLVSLDKTYLIRSVFCISLILGAAACAMAEEESPPTPEVRAAGTQGIPGSGLSAGDEGDLVSQWAVDAEASSEYASPEWGAEKATGPPDAPGCGDYQYAWASTASDAVDTLTLTYDTPVYPVEIVVVESFHPDQVVKVEVRTLAGEFLTIYESEPMQVDRPCPYQLTVPVPELEERIDGVRITVDQSVLGLGWNEIDAVQLVGREGE
ncbi:MAG: hypothetical protein R6U57_12560 [Anaerolineales bacterium]